MCRFIPWHMKVFSIPGYKCKRAHKFVNVKSFSFRLPYCLFRGNLRGIFLGLDQFAEAVKCDH